MDDDTEVFIKSLPIARLRKFMEKMDGLSKIETEGDYIDFVLEAAVYCLEKNPRLLGRDDLAEVVDLPTAYKVIEVCGGVKLNDPKLAEMAEALERMNTKESAGTN